MCVSVQDQCRPDATYINTVPGIPDHPVAVHPAPPVAPVVTTDQQIVVSCAAPVMSNAATLAVGAFDSSMMTVSGTLTRSTDDRRLPSSKTSGDDGSTFKPADVSLLHSNSHLTHCIVFVGIVLSVRLFQLVSAGTKSAVYLASYLLERPW